MQHWDAVVVGGGPAGLSCAFWLARYGRRVCVFDTAEPRNEPAWAVHGYPGLPEPTPTELRNAIRQQSRESGAAVVFASVTSVAGSKNAFQVTTAAGGEYRCRRVVLAYGLFDRFPEVPGLEPLYGRAVFHCPDCDGPEANGRPVAVIGHDHAAAALALYLLHWTDRVSLIAHLQPLQLDIDRRERLARHLTVLERRITSVEAENGSLHALLLDDGRRVEAERIFFHIGAEPRSNIGQHLGCKLSHTGYLQVDRGQETSIPGVYAAGDITGPPHLASIAAADGVRAALSIHRSLLPPELEL